MPTSTQPTTTTTASRSPPVDDERLASTSSIRGSAMVSISQGTGESWTVGGANGNSTAEPVTAYYDLYDTKSTPYDLTDDGLPVASSGSAFQNLDLDDASLGGSNGSGSCQGLAWHSGWWLLAQRPVRRHRRHGLPPAHPFQCGQPGQHHRAQRVRDLGDRHRRHAAGLRCRRHGRVCPPPGRPSLASSTWPRSTRCTPARRCRSTCGTRATPGALSASLQILVADRRRVRACRVHLQGDPRLDRR